MSFFFLAKEDDQSSWIGLQMSLDPTGTVCGIPECPCGPEADKPQIWNNGTQNGEMKEQ